MVLTMLGMRTEDREDSEPKLTLDRRTQQTFALK
jgi:hypothetical protein